MPENNDHEQRKKTYAIQGNLIVEPSNNSEESKVPDTTLHDEDSY